MELPQIKLKNPKDVLLLHNKLMKHQSDIKVAQHKFLKRQFHKLKHYYKHSLNHLDKEKYIILPHRLTVSQVLIVSIALYPLVLLSLTILLKRRTSEVEIVL